MAYHAFSLPILLIGRSMFDTLSAQVQMNMYFLAGIHADDGSKAMVMNTEILLVVTEMKLLTNDYDMIITFNSPKTIRLKHSESFEGSTMHNSCKFETTSLYTE